MTRGFSFRACRRAAGILWRLTMFTAAEAASPRPYLFIPPWRIISSVSARRKRARQKDPRILDAPRIHIYTCIRAYVSRSTERSFSRRRSSPSLFSFPSSNFLGWNSLYALRRGEFEGRCCVHGSARKSSMMVWIFSRCIARVQAARRVLVMWLFRHFCEKRDKMAWMAATYYERRGF